MEKAASEGDLHTFLFDQVLSFNLVQDVNKSIENQHLLTYKFEDASDVRFFTTPVDNMRLLSLIFVKISHSFDNELNPIDLDTTSELVRKNLTTLAITTQDLLTQYYTALTTKKNKEETEHFMRMVEEFIFDKGLTRYQDWTGVQEVINSKA